MNSRVKLKTATYFTSLLVNPKSAIKFRILKDIHWWVRLFDLLLKLVYIALLIGATTSVPLNRYLGVPYWLLGVLTVTSIVTEAYFVIYRLLIYILMYIAYGSNLNLVSPEKYFASEGIYQRLFWWLIVISLVGTLLVFYVETQLANVARVNVSEIDFGFRDFE